MLGSEARERFATENREFFDCLTLVDEAVMERGDLSFESVDPGVAGPGVFPASRMTASRVSNSSRRRKGEGLACEVAGSFAEGALLRGSGRLGAFGAVVVLVVAGLDVAGRGRRRRWLGQRRASSARPQVGLALRKLRISRPGEMGSWARRVLRADASATTPEI
ncbi:hypothetical protein GCM10022419_093820 [Nonomuraea rosea]|uniref:Uncharacterized protein n=1 Tax=Nonomuraea rosea TaxID=638574 RepID=A0ABP6Z3P4_9ACTN